MKIVLYKNRYWQIRWLFDSIIKSLHSIILQLSDNFFPKFLFSAPKTKVFITKMHMYLMHSCVARLQFICIFDKISSVQQDQAWKKLVMHGKHQPCKKCSYATNICAKMHAFQRRRPFLNKMMSGNLTYFRTDLPKMQILQKKSKTWNIFLVQKLQKFLKNFLKKK